MKDKNEAQRNKPVEMIQATAYGRLDYILALTLPEDEFFGIDRPQTFILAHITEAKGSEGDASENIVSYRQMGRSFILDIKSVENVVGRVETKGVVAAGEWVIIDRSSTTCRTTFHGMEERDIND
jgi:hypothetical protein